MKRTCLFILLCMLYMANLCAQNITAHNIYSTSFQQNRSFRAWTPEGYNPELKYGVIYVLDADYLFDISVANLAYYSDIDHIPPVIVVAVDYTTPGDRFDIGMSLEDLTLDSIGVKFSNFINNELIAYIDKTYSTNGLNTFIGHSYTATYLVHHIINRNKNFGQYIFWAPENISIKTDTLKFDKEYLRDRKFIFISAANDLKRRIQFADDLYSIFMKQTDSVAFLRKATVNASHNSMIPEAAVQSINLLFDKYFGGDQLYRFIEESSLDAESIWKTALNNNKKLYNCSIMKDAGNALYLLDKAEDENNHRLIKEIVDEFTSEKDANLLEILGSFLDDFDVETAEKYFIKSIRLYSEQNKNDYSLNVRKRYAKKILAPRNDFEKAWEILSPDIGYPKNFILEYEKGRLSAKYNYKTAEGLKCLKICLEDKHSLGNFTSLKKEILYAIAQCYKNLGNKKLSVEYIDKALSLEPDNQEYLSFKKTISKKQ